jgi:hypothetical protein
VAAQLAEGTLYVADSGDRGRLLKVAAGSSTPTVLPFAGLNTPQGVAALLIDNPDGQPCPCLWASVANDIAWPAGLAGNYLPGASAERYRACSLRGLSL